MIGKPEWFERRKYSGWGLTPKTWQGWAYIGLIIIPFIILQALPNLDVSIRVIGTVVWVLFLVIDVGHIMFSMKIDERESKIESISERNAAWAMITIASVGIIYQVVVSALNQKPINSKGLV